MQSSLVQAFDCLRVNERRFWWHIYCMLPAWISDHERRFADNLSKETAYSWIIVSVSLFRLCGNINGVPDYNRRQKCWNILRSGGNCEIKNPLPPPPHHCHVGRWWTCRTWVHNYVLFNKINSEIGEMGSLALESNHLKAGRVSYNKIAFVSTTYVWHYS